MTVYNDEKYVAETIESILCQTFKKIEFIIVDDNSTDKSLSILKSFAEKDKRIRLISKGKMGRSKALSHALALAKYEFIANVDSDDPSYTKRLEKQADFLRENPEISLVGTASNLIDSKGKLIKKWTVPEKNSEIKYEMGKGCPFNHSSVMFRKKDINKIGGYNTELSYQIDKDLWIRLLKNYKAKNLREVLATKRIHEGQFFEQGVIKNNLLKNPFSSENTIIRSIKELGLPKSLLYRYYIKVFLLFFYLKLPTNLKIKIKKMRFRSE